MKKLLLLFAVFAVSTLAQNVTSIRVFHGVASGPNVDVYLNSVSDANLIARNLSPGNVSEYKNVTETNPQNAQIIVTQTGSTTNIIANQTANLSSISRAGTILVVPGTSAGNTSAGANATSANATSGASINLVVLNDQFGNGQPAPQNTSLLRFVNVANTTGANATSGNTTSAGALSLRLNNGTVLFPNVNYLDPNVNYIALAPGNYNLELVGASGQVIATDQVNLAAGQALTFFAFVPAAAAAPALVRGTDTPVILFAPIPAPGTGAGTSGIATSGAATSGAVTSGAVTSGALTSGAVTSGAMTSGVATGATTGVPATGVIITGFTSGIQRPVSAAGTLKCDIATLGVVCAILFTVFYRRD